MRKLIPFILSVLAGTTLKAQGNYTFSHSSQAYVEISAGTTLFPSGFFDTLALGFNFTLDGRTNDTLKLRLKGTISADTINTIAERIFEPFGGEHGQGLYSYITEGVPGSRIVKIQYKNVKFDHDMIGNDRINFQVWLYETTNVVEVHYGPSTIQNPLWDYYYGESGPYVGFIGFMLTGPVANPSPDTAVGLRVTGTPANGKVFKFQPATTSVTQYQNTNTAINIYPNPVYNMLFLSEATDVTISDLTGKRILRTKTTEQDRSIDISELPQGTYLIETRKGNSVFSKL